MPTPSSHYLITSTYGPANLLITLNKLMEAHRSHPDAPDFDFDYMKRKIELSARTSCTAEDLLEAFLLTVNKAAGSGLLLPGPATRDTDAEGIPLKGDKARVRIPIGVLLQTPDIYVETLADALREYGVRGITLEDDGDGFAVPHTKKNLLLNFDEFITSFPLPAYLKVVEK